jgi:hypothetical protein
LGKTDEKEWRIEEIEEKQLFFNKSEMGKIFEIF